MASDSANDLEEGKEIKGRRAQKPVIKRKGRRSFGV